MVFLLITLYISLKPVKLIPLISVNTTKVVRKTNIKYKMEQINKLANFDNIIFL